MEKTNKSKEQIKITEIKRNLNLFNVFKKIKSYF